MLATEFASLVLLIEFASFLLIMPFGFGCMIHHRICDALVRICSSRRAAA